MSVEWCACCSAATDELTLGLSDILHSAFRIFINNSFVCSRFLLYGKRQIDWHIDCHIFCILLFEYCLDSFVCFRFLLYGEKVSTIPGDRCEVSWNLHIHYSILWHLTLVSLLWKGYEIHIRFFLTHYLGAYMLQWTFFWHSTKILRRVLWC